MSFQTIQDKTVYVVDFDTMPALPIVGTGVEQYYAEALTDAIRRGTIAEPGKYGIEVDFTTMKWNVYKITE